MCVWMYSQGHSLFQFPHLSHGSQLPMSLHNFRYWTLSEKTIPAKSNGGFCSLMPIWEADGLWGPTVSRRFHSNKAWANPSHCDDYKWRNNTPVAPEEVFSSISNCESGTDGQGAIVKFRSIDGKPVRIRFSFLDFLLISFICYWISESSKVSTRTLVIDSVRSYFSSVDFIDFHELHPGIPASCWFKQEPSELTLVSTQFMHSHSFKWNCQTVEISYTRDVSTLIIPRCCVTLML